MPVLDSFFPLQQQGGEYLRSNQNSAIISQLLDGVVTVDVTAGDVTLTNATPDTSQLNYALIRVVGAPGVARNVFLPASLTGFRRAIDATTGGFAITLKPSGGTGLVVPKVAFGEFYSDGAAVTTVSVAPTGAAGGDLTGTYPNPTLATSGVTAATYGDASHVTQVAFDAKGRATSASSVAIAIAESQVTGLVSDLALKAPLASPALTGTPTATTASAGDNSTRIATTAYTDSAVAAAVTGLLKYVGATDCSASPNFPAATKGDSYVVSVAGKIGGASGVSVDAGDVYFADATNAGGTQAAVGASWVVLEHNLVGALLSANNLSDLTSASAARGNLGLGTAAVTNTGTGAGNTILGNDARLTDSRNPLAHKTTHYTGGSDPLTPGNIGAEDPANKNIALGYAGLDAGSKLTGSQQVYGTTANTAAQGNDSRITGAAVDSTVVHLAGTETITGQKSFTPAANVGLLVQPADATATASVTQSVIKAYVELNPTADSATTFTSYWGTVMTKAASSHNFTGTVAGYFAEAFHAGSGTVANLVGGAWNASVNAGSGLVTSLIGSHSNLAVAATAAATTAYGFYSGLANSGTVGTYCALYSDATTATADYGLYLLSAKNYLNGKLGVGTNTPSARLHLAAGSAAASSAPLKLGSGTIMTTPEAGAMEYDGTHLYFTIGATRYTLDGAATVPTGTGLVHITGGVEDGAAYTLVAADIPSLAASKITTGLLSLARGGTNADLSATGGTSQVLKQTTVGGAVTVAQLAASDLSNGTTGSGGGVVLATSPTIVTPTIASFANAGHTHTNAAGGGQLTDAALSAAVGLAKGGTNADLSATGGANQIVRQNSSGGAFTVSVLAAGDIPNLDAAKITTGVLAIGRLATGTPDGTKFVRDDGTLVTPPGAGGSAGTVDITATAGESIAARDCVYIEDAGGINTAGRAYRADATYQAKSSLGWLVGFATAAATVGNPVTIRIVGVLTGFSSLTAGGLYYADSTPGAITATAPTFSRLVGIALPNGTDLLVNTRGAQDVPVITSTTGFKGYSFGGYTPSIVATADKLVFATETTAAQSSANLSLARYSQAGFSDGVATKGYSLGGYSGSNSTVADKTTLSNDTTAANSGANLSVARNNLCGLSERSTKGYSLGGSTGSNSAVADKTTFSTDTTGAAASANLSAARHHCRGLNGGSTKGYVLGGNSGSVVATADKLTFSGDSTAAQSSANLSAVREGGATVSDGASKGYYLGGSANDSSGITTSDKITFSGDATAALSSANLSQARFNQSGMSQGNSKGYALGGESGSYYATADKCTYATDTTAAQSSANLSGVRSLADAWSDAGL